MHEGLASRSGAAFVWFAGASDIQLGAAGTPVSDDCSPTDRVTLATSQKSVAVLLWLPVFSFESQKCFS